MLYLDVLIEKAMSIRGLAYSLGLPYETVRDRLNNNTSPSDYREGVSEEIVKQACQLMDGGLSIRKTANLVGVSKSHLHRLVIKYRRTLNEEKN